MNELLTPFYEFWFDYDLYKDLIRSVFKENHFGFIGWGIILVTIILLTTFYKFWDPITGQKHKWIITLILNSLLAATVSFIILFNNVGLLRAIGEGTKPDADFFIFQIAAISALYSFLLALIFSLLPLPVRFFSNNNKHNPI